MGPVVNNLNVPFEIGVYTNPVNIAVTMQYPSILVNDEAAAVPPARIVVTRTTLPTDSIMQLRSDTPHRLANTFQLSAYD